MRQDHAEAARWFHLAAGQGDADAQHKVGSPTAPTRRKPTPEDFGLPPSNTERAINAEKKVEGYGFRPHHGNDCPWGISWTGVRCRGRRCRCIRRRVSRVVPHLDVRGLQVPVDDTLLMRGFQRLCDLLRYRERLVDGYRPLPDPISQRWPVDQLKNQCLLTLSLFQP